MSVNRTDLIKEIGKRLKTVQLNHKLSNESMYTNLGSSRNSLYKIESGQTMPNLDILYALHKKFNISMDWLLFNFGPMYLAEKSKIQESAVVKESAPGELQKLFDLMDNDSLFMHEIMSHFYRYTSGKE